mgnify:CR=1 FL=1
MSDYQYLRVTQYEPLPPAEPEQTEPEQTVVIIDMNPEEDDEEA